MGRPRKNEDIGKPWVVRDVPEHIRREVRVYAAQHDLTTAQAVEALVEGRYGNQEDRELLQALLKVYGRVIVEDMPGAQAEAKQVTGILERRRLEGRLDPSLQLPEPAPSQETSIPGLPELTAKVAFMRRFDWASFELDPLMSPTEIVLAYMVAYFVDGAYTAAARLLSTGTAVRANRPGVEQQANYLQLVREPHGRLEYAIRDVEIRPPVFTNAQKDRCEVEVRYIQVPLDDPTAGGVVAKRTFVLTRERINDHDEIGWLIYDTGGNETKEMW